MLDYINVAIVAALSAGKIVKKGFGTSFEVHNKPGKQNYVTEFDRAAEAAIISIIKKAYPSHNFLAEESGHEKNRDGDVTWIIDPLDGTTNFAHNIPLVAVSIAAYLDQEALCGVIYQPFSDELFVAEKDKGATLNGVQLSMSHTEKLEEALIITNLPFDAESTPQVDLNGLLEINQMGATLRNFGSAALGLAYLAAGKIDAFWMYNLFPWDFAAGKLLIEEAGGRFTQFDQKVSSYPPPANVLAANPSLHEKFQEFLISKS